MSVSATFGALMVGGMFAILFCGVTQAQTFLYFKLYPKDRGFIKSLVLFIWMLDTLHSAFIATALWDHLIRHFGNAEHVDYVPWSLALTIALTAVLTFSVHLFLIFRIWQLSRKNYYLSSPLVLLAIARLFTTSKLVLLRSLEKFVDKYTWSFTTGLVISTALDILITLSLILLLRSRRNNVHSTSEPSDPGTASSTSASQPNPANENGGSWLRPRNSWKRSGSRKGGLGHRRKQSVNDTQEFSRMNAVLDALWLTMKHNLIFLGLHFVISKFYANSLLITLNTRLNLKPSSFRQQNTNLTTIGGHSAQPSLPNAAAHRHHHSHSFRGRRIEDTFDGGRFTFDNTEGYFGSQAVVLNDMERQEVSDKTDTETGLVSTGRVEIKINVARETMVDDDRESTGSMVKGP
ncbi:hypothetical protein DFP72DRAFT_913710 [Ephemerocybe angulata]|uniref:Uncharacterized protein n=1 Tax=Ephemerocybe angulata TaxID=980116 RepID=A0A8H6HMA4_9AGAR|nr:hypothetical protein DFP72DRAFT_913710 [Tulosesus angulatus]